MNTKKPFYKRWWFIAIAGFLILVAILPTPKPIEVSEDTAEAAEEVDAKPKKTNAEIKAEKEAAKAEYETSTYINTIKPAAVAIMDDMAADWQNNWEITLPAYEAGRLTAETAHNRMNMAYDFLLGVDHDVIEFDKKKSTEAGRKQVDEIYRAIDDAIINRMSAVKVTADAIDDGRLKPSDANQVLDHVAQAEQALAKAEQIIADLDAKYAE